MPQPPVKGAARVGRIRHHRSGVRAVLVSHHGNVEREGRIAMIANLDVVHADALVYAVVRQRAFAETARFLTPPDGGRRC